MANDKEVPVGLQFGPGTFTDAEFLEAAKEVVNPDLTDYEFFVESHGTKIYRHYREDTGLYEYKIHGVMSDMDPKLCAQVYVDLEYRKKWDTFVLDLDIIKDDDGAQGLYWCVDFPWPMSDRDYTFIRDMKIIELDGVITYVVLARYHRFSSKPEREAEGIIRVDDFKQACIMQSDGKVGSKAYMYYYDNPKGMIPTWLINWGAKTGVPQYLSIMRKAVFGYNDFLEAKRKEAGLETLDNEERMRKLYNVDQNLAPL